MGCCSYCVSKSESDFQHFQVGRLRLWRWGSRNQGRPRELKRVWAARFFPAAKLISGRTSLLTRFQKMRGKSCQSWLGGFLGQWGQCCSGEGARMAWDIHPGWGRQICDEVGALDICSQYLQGQRARLQEGEDLAWAISTLFLKYLKKLGI